MVRIQTSFPLAGVLSSIIYQGILEAASVLFVYWAAIQWPDHTAANTPGMSAAALVNYNMPMR